MQINAGATHIIGRPVTKVDRERSQIRVESWAKSASPAAAKATSHAAHIGMRGTSSTILGSSTWLR
jgi:hypothetical protein